MKLPYLQIKKQFHAFQPKIFPLCFWLHLFFFFFPSFFNVYDPVYLESLWNVYTVNYIYFKIFIYLFYFWLH